LRGRAGRYLSSDFVTRRENRKTFGTQSGKIGEFNMHISQLQPYHVRVVLILFFRSVEILSQQRGTKKVGRPKLPKDEARGKRVSVRFALDEAKAIAARARASKKNVSEWIRSTIHANLEG
jgi:hypothetical protein